MTPINGFFGHIKHNDLMSGVMFLGFMVAAQLMAAIILLLPLTIIDVKHSPLAGGGYFVRYAPLVLLGSGAVFIKLFTEHVNTVRQQLHFRYIDKSENRRLATIIETLALTAGIQSPRFGIIETSARNAFACGLDARDAVIVVTRGLLDTLSHDELEAVIAHEITHIVNGDIRLIAAANVMVSCLEFANRKNPFVMRSWWRFLFIPIFPVVLLISGFIKWVAGFALDLGKVSRLVISTSREYVADAEAVRLTHKPEALISALLRIENRSAIDGLRPENDAMMIDGATMGAYASHPTIAERVAVLAKLAGISGAHTEAPPQKEPIVEPNQIQPLQRKASLWRRFNDYLDRVDAREAAREAVKPKSLFERVKIVGPPSKSQTFAKIAKFGGAGIVLFYFISATFFSMGPIGRAEVATSQSDGTFMRHGVVLTAGEYKKMKYDMRFAPVSILQDAPTELRSHPIKAETTRDGLRGLSLTNEAGRL